MDTTRLKVAMMPSIHSPVNSTVNQLLKLPDVNVWLNLKRPSPQTSLVDKVSKASKTAYSSSVLTGQNTGSLGKTLVAVKQSQNSSSKDGGFSFLTSP
ncbi:MAG: hypothetical protein KGJ35_03875, partial [Patescibacteria group bacterium]|nr:hypothetical protein [Patescibacteria group bacterium]